MNFLTDYLCNYCTCSVICLKKADHQNFPDLTLQRDKLFSDPYIHITACIEHTMRRFKKSTQANPPVLLAVQLGLIPANTLPQGRRPYRLGNTPLAVPGRVITHEGVFSQIIETENLDGRIYDSLGVDDGGDDGDEEEFISEGDDSSEDCESEDIVLCQVARAAKKEKQWRTWSEQVIPALLKPYMLLLWETDSLRILHARGGNQCHGCAKGRRVEVSCVFFESKC